MAVTVTRARPHEATIAPDGAELGEAGGNLGLQYRIVDIAWDSSYPTGGEAVSLAQLELDSALFMVTVEGYGYVAKHDRTNNKVLLYWADEDAVADGALAEVANTTNLATLTTRLLFIGRRAQSAP